MPKNEQQNMYYIEDRNNFKLIAKSSFYIAHANVPYVAANPVYHYHDCYELYYLFSGDRYYFIKDKTYRIERGTFVLINSYDIHSTSHVAEQGYERILINFKKDFLDGFMDLVDDVDLFACFDKNIRTIKLSFQEQHYAESLLKRMLKEDSAKEAGYESYLKTLLIQLLTFLSRHKESVIENCVDYNSANHKNISEIAGYINNHYQEDMTLTSICEQFFISPYYFSRTFKKVTGFTFVEYLNGVRIKEAQKLLSKTAMSISDISEAVGYKSLTHFGRVFKSITGLSPMHFRKLQKNDE